MKIFSSLAVSSIIATTILSPMALAYEDYKSLKFTSYTFKQSSWTENQYVGDLREVVNFADSTAHVFEFRSPNNKEFSFDISAAIRSDENGDTELESILGAVDVGGVFFRVESSSAPGFIAPAEGGQFNNKYVIGERGFTASYQQINIGKRLEHIPSARWGLGYIHVTQPGSLSLYTVNLDSGFSGQANYPSDIIDPEYNHRLLGVWLDYDNLQAAMHDERGFALSMNQSGNFRYGYGLTMDMILGVLASSTDKNFEKEIKDNYGLDLEYEDPYGIGWSVTYRLEYIMAYRFPSSNLGVSLGLEGRAFQGLYSESFLGGTSMSIDDASEAGLQLTPGDNQALQYGPFIRLAWEI